jgi:hypothetical protein
VRCVVPPRQLIEIDLFRNSSARLMAQPSLANLNPT